MSGCSSVTRSFNSSCLFVMLLIFSCRSVKSFWLGCDVVACECVVELSVVVWVVRAEGGSLRFWGPGLLSTSPAFSMSSASHSAGSSGWLAPKTGACRLHHSLLRHSWSFPYNPSRLYLFPSHWSTTFHHFISYTLIWTTIGLSLIYALLLKYWKNLFYPKYLPTSTLTIFTILVNQHIVQVTALKQLFWKLLMICSFLLTKAIYLY